MFSEMAWWLYLAGWLVLGGWAGAHALMYKRDPGSALGWSVICLLVPYIGPLVYLGFGVNRIGKHAQHLGHGPALQSSRRPVSDLQVPKEIASNAAAFIRISNRITHRPIVAGNHVQPFFSGDTAYAAMLDDIKRARRSVMLATYIFRTDTSGRHFIRPVLKHWPGPGQQKRRLTGAFLWPVAIF